MTKLFEAAMEGRWELVIEIYINKKACQAMLYIYGYLRWQRADVKELFNPIGEDLVIGQQYW